MMFDFIYYSFLPLSILYFDIYVCYMFNKITYLLTYLMLKAESEATAVSGNGNHCLTQ